MFSYIILGIIQGIFEWLPISSEGLVALVSQALVKDFQPIEIALFAHLGTFFAVLIYFRQDWFRVLTFKDKELFRFLVVSVTLSGIVGFFLYKFIKEIAFGNTLLLITGFALLFTAYFYKIKRRAKLNFDQLALLSGLAQGLAVIPGLSRSASTIFALSWSDLETEDVLKVSYMMSAPAVLGMSLFLFLENPSLVWQGWPVLVFSFLVGLLTLDILLKLAAKIDFFKFILIFALLCFVGFGLNFVL